MKNAWVRVLVGVLIGTVVGNIGGTLASVFERAQKHAEVRKGWSAFPVMTVNRDLAAGDLLTMDNLELRSIAEPFVVNGVVKAADATYLPDSRLRVAMKRGQPVEWSFIATVKREERESHEACVAAIAAQRGGTR